MDFPNRDPRHGNDNNHVRLSHDSNSTNADREIVTSDAPCISSTRDKEKKKEKEKIASVPFFMPPQDQTPCSHELNTVTNPAGNMLLSPDKSKLATIFHSAHLGNEIQNVNKVETQVEQNIVVEEGDDIECNIGVDAEIANKDSNQESCDVMDIDDVNHSKADDSDSEMESVQSVQSYCFDESDNESRVEKKGTDERISKHFDADLVIQNIKLGEAALEQVKGRDCVLIVGKTGTGKSTLVQALAGRKIHEIQHTCSFGNGHQMDIVKKTVYEAVDPLAGFEIGHEKKSKTTTINCYDPYCASNETFTGKKNLMFVDSPGFEDTGGPEGDIATSVLLSQVASRCKSLRFVIMINYVSLLEDRGGSMRSVLKLIRSFTGDFDKDKRNFMFLFTHSNEIKIVPDDIDGAKVCLYDEIIRTYEGTHDEDTKSVLDFIRLSLKRDFPFVNVFLPLKTNCDDLAKSIHTLKVSNKPHLANNCGLTSASHMTLRGVLQDRLQDLRRDLSTEEPPMDEVCNTLHLFEYFERYVRIEDVRNLKMEVDSLFENFTQQQISILERGMERGTNADKQFGPADAASMKGAFSCLQALQGRVPLVFDCRDIQIKMQEKLVLFCDGMKIESGESFKGIHDNLTKLEVWTREFKDQILLYEGVKSHLMKLIHDTTQGCTLENVDDFLLSCSSNESEIKKLIKYLGVLKSIEEEKECLASHGLDIKHACLTYHTLMEKIVLNINYWKSHTNTALANHGEVNIQKIKDTAQVSLSFDSLDRYLEQSALCQDLKRDVKDIKQSLANNTIGFFEAFASQIETFTGQSHSRYFLEHTELASKLFVAIGNGMYRRIGVIHNNAVEKIKLIVMKKEFQMKQVTQEIERQGIKDGSENGRSLFDFRSFDWFDVFLPDDTKLVKNLAISFDRIFSERIKSVQNQIDKAFYQIRDDSFHSELLVNALKSLFMEVVQISFLVKEAPIDCVDKAFEHNAREEFRGIVSSFTKKHRGYVNEWKGVVVSNKGSMREVNSLNKKVDYILQEINHFGGIDAHCDEILSDLHTFTIRVSQEIANFIKDAMNVSKEYERKLQLLRNARSIQKYSMIAEYMPTFEELKTLARNVVASDAKEIEDLVSQTSEWDEINNLLTQFEKAKILDEFTNNEATSRLSPLQKLKEQKQEEVDAHLEQMIRDEDFSGIGKFLDPYAKSNDQIKVQKFNQWLNKISSSLSDTVGCVTRNIEGDMKGSTCDGVAKSLQKLDLAIIQLKKHLSILRGGLDLKEELSNLKINLNDKFRSLITQLEYSVDKRDYEAMGIMFHSAQMYIQSSVSKYINPANKKVYGQMQKRYKTSKGDVPIFIAKYFDSKFEDSEVCFQILHTLKNANECSSMQLRDLQHIYDDTRKLLRDKLNNVVSSLQESLSKTGCYDDVIAIMSSLDNHMKSILKNHVDIAKISFDSSKQLEEWMQAKLAIDLEMDFDGNPPKDTILKWKDTLGKLDPSNSLMTRYAAKWISGTTYRTKVSEMHQLMGNWSKKGNKALSDGDYNLLVECLNILDLIEGHLGKHIKGAKHQSEKLKQLATKRFLSICGQARKNFQLKKRTRFEAIFPDYRGYVIHCPFVTENTKCRKEIALTNQLAYEALEEDAKRIHKMCEGCEFKNLQKEIEQARQFGNFVADHYMLLKEEMRRCDHIEIQDIWVQRMYDICIEHYSNGRSLSRLKDFATLELIPSATKNEVKKAYKKFAKRYHPDKSGSSDTNGLFRGISEAKDRLLEIIDSRKETELPFGDLIKHIGTLLRENVKACLNEQRYDRVKSILFGLKDLKYLEKLVCPPLDHCEIINDVHKLVSSYVKQVKTTVKSCWSARDYDGLNNSITDLKMMEDSFKSYENIFPSSWNEGIVKDVEEEILVLAKRARGYLKSKTSAKNNVDDFRQCFLKMGHVLLELPLFKDFTKAEMGRVLGTCLDFEGGYSFLFEFGLGLSKGEENGDAYDNNVAQMLLSEFSHFKEVMTMVWNEETSQKPAEDTVHDIKGFQQVDGLRSDLALDKDSLLESFNRFEAEYTRLLGQYLTPEADLRSLVSRTNNICEQLCPLDLRFGWNPKVKKAIPSILAGVFTAFTVQKSGASFNQLESVNSGTTNEKLLMKPHNIQVLTLLTLFGCGTTSSSSLKSQLMQIRTGEGKSMILGAAAVVLTLLQFRVRCVCYSEYLSTRDFNLFRDVFDLFSVTEYVNYSKITTLSEDNTSTKGNIRDLTNSMLRGEFQERTFHYSNNKNTSSHISSTSTNISLEDNQENAPKRRKSRRIKSLEDNLDNATNTKRKSPKRRKSRRTNSPEDNPKNDASTYRKSPERSKSRRTKDTDQVAAVTSNNDVNMHNIQRKEILLVDEVDVFFGADFYGQTYNQVTEFREPEIVEILNYIWIANKRSTRRQRLADVQALSAYTQLLAKAPSFKFLFDAEISLMIDQVRKVDEEPYILHPETDRIGYKVMDSISYEATYGYRTVFAYIKEAENNKLKDKNSTLKRALAMPISCGRFSYAQFSPDCILGVSGTLSALGDFEYEVLSKYGVETFMFVPSVYGKSNFQFDKAGSGIRIDVNTSDYFHSITDQIKVLTKQNRAVIVFFENSRRLHEFRETSYYGKLGRHKKLLTENLSRGEKEFIISKAATAKQITISTAVFGRGTDFFCKDESVQKNGGVHVIQTFLSEEQSEEIQIQGRTARQGKKGSYEMILLASDLEEKFGISNHMKDKVAKGDWYDELCNARKRLLSTQQQTIEENLVDANQKDKATHAYFDSLLAGNSIEAAKRFKEIYKSFKSGQMPSSMELDIGFLIDITGSMAPYIPSVVKTVDAMLKGKNSIAKKLKSKFPDITFSLRVGVLGYRDIEDTSQFIESNCVGTCHFTDDMNLAMSQLKTITSSPSGGGDLAEDHLGAIQRCINWQSDDDWTSTIKLMLLLTDAPTHGMVPEGSKEISNVDSYSVRHPLGITAKGVTESLVKNDIDLFFCSFNPSATSTTENTLSALFMKHPENTEQRLIVSVPMVAPCRNEIVPKHGSRTAEVLGGHGQHIVFVLDMSSSMAHHWSGVVVAYNQYLVRRRQNQSESDLVSVVQFHESAETTVIMAHISEAPNDLSFRGGGTCFYPAANNAFELASKTPSTHSATVVFMSDGATGDADAAAGKFSELNRNIRQSRDNDLELHVIAFGHEASSEQLQKIAGSSRRGKLYTSVNTVELSNIFVEIAGGSNVAAVLEAEIGKRISDAVSDRLSLEYVA